MNVQNKEIAIQNEQQICEHNTIKSLINIESYLKSIADSLDKIAYHGVTINPTGYYLKNTDC